MWTTALLITLIAIAPILALLRLRGWALSWGASAQELRHAWVGDDLSPHTAEISTRAITIRARPDTVWSWLIQMGQDRAGFYSYTWLENLFGCAMPRVERIVPEWQERTIGDTVWLARRDRYHGDARQKVVDIVPGRVLVLASPSDWGRILRHESSEGGTWAFIVLPIGPHTTRLIVRSRGPQAPTFYGRLFWRVVFEPAHFIMERKMMLRLKALSEQTADSQVRMAS